MELFPLWNSLRISLVASVITFFLGILFAYYVAMLPGSLKGVVDTILTIPMVLPPTVIGFMILKLISPKSSLGMLIYKYFQVTLTMKWYAAILAVVVVTFPLMYRTARSSFEAFDQNIISAGKTLCLSNTYIFWRILLPNCKAGISAGFILAFARGLGEYGATSMVAGYIANKTATISTTVAYFWKTNQDAQAMQWVLINIVISFIVMLGVNIFEKRISFGKER
ncbi:MAG: molybdate ABC transporter permease subunit [Lachnospiraceae bacterium]|nr:molybdate ABC transporter permease subunit [Lachnospiraceae bacterium]